jgi:hypothetical protein
MFEEIKWEYCWVFFFGWVFWGGFWFFWGGGGFLGVLFDGGFFCLCVGCKEERKVGWGMCFCVWLVFGFCWCCFGLVCLCLVDVCGCFLGGGVFLCFVGGFWVCCCCFFLFWLFCLGRRNKDRREKNKSKGWYLKDD